MINQLLAKLEMANRKLKEKDKEIENLKDLCDKYGRFCGKEVV